MKQNIVVQVVKEDGMGLSPVVILIEPYSEFSSSLKASSWMQGLLEVVKFIGVTTIRIDGVEPLGKSSANSDELVSAMVASTIQAGHRIRSELKTTNTLAIEVYQLGSEVVSDVILEFPDGVDYSPDSNFCLGNATSSMLKLLSIVKKFEPSDSAVLSQIVGQPGLLPIRIGLSDRIVFEEEGPNVPGRRSKRDAFRSALYVYCLHLAALGFDPE